MKIRVCVQWVREGTCEIEVPDDANFATIKKTVESLIRDDFRESSETHDVSIYRVNARNSVQLPIDPYMPQLN